MKMTNIHIYVVRGSDGEFSSRREWMVRAFWNEAAARDFATSCKTMWIEAGRPGEEWIHPLDPGFAKGGQACNIGPTDWHVESCPIEGTEQMDANR
jgi:hypothetical protein